MNATSFRTPLTLAVCALFTGVLVPGVLSAQEEPPEGDVPYVPTPHEVVRQMLELARPTASDSLYDLGSGDGRIVIAAADRHGTPGVGIEIDSGRVERARDSARVAGVDSLVEFVQGDLFEQDFSGATVLTLYLLPHVNMKLRPRILGDVRPGARVVSHDFDMGKWEPDSVVEMEEEDGGHATVYFWIVPADVEGTWELIGPHGGEYTLRLEQRFQELRGSASRAGETATLEDVSVVGDSVRMVLPGRVAPGGDSLELVGRAAGDRMEGRGAAGSWTARRVERDDARLDMW